MKLRWTVASDPKQQVRLLMRGQWTKAVIVFHADHDGYEWFTCDPSASGWCKTLREARASVDRIIKG